MLLKITPLRDPWLTVMAQISVWGFSEVEERRPQYKGQALVSVRHRA